MKAVLFVDHEIGHRIVARILAAREGVLAAIDVLAVFTTQENGSSWWPAVEPLLSGTTIPLHVYTPQSQDLLETYRDADYFFLLSWKHLLPDRVLAIPRRGVVNLHYSLLPQYRGVYPVNWSIIKGEERTGVSFHLVTASIDAGPLISQVSVAINADDTARTLQLRLDDAADEGFANSVAMLLGGDRDAMPQEGDGSYFSRADFNASNEIDLLTSRTGREWLDLLRGKTFDTGSPLLFFTDPASGDRVYVSINLERREAPTRPDFTSVRAG